MNKIEPLTLEETKLKEEMKSRCLTKGQYIDEKAEDKFKMLCHLEDYEIQYYDLLNTIEELRSWIEDRIHNIVPKGCGINYNCEYESEEDYVRAMEERSSLNTLKDTLSKLNELEGKNE